ncbi:hypothetical protein, partial [Salmonella enterica]|uniref:hypothetical protein n=1 Tax=Salmonella enterica TaxID=28901 RepID=UPI0022B6FD44
MTVPVQALHHTLQYIGQVQELRGPGLGLRLPGKYLPRRFKNDTDIKLSSIAPKLARVLLT